MNWAELTMEEPELSLEERERITGISQADLKALADELVQFM